LTLQAKTFKTGMPSSSPASEAYILEGTSPSISPGTGTYTSAQTVSMATPTSGAEIRYTLDNSDPQATSTLYTAPFSLATTSTIRARAFKTGWQTSAVTAVGHTYNYGTLAAPTISPAGGTYSTDQTVTLTGPAGAIVRYTTDGGSVTTTSPTYSAPITVSAPLTGGNATTVRARAFRQDWTASGTTSEIYSFKAGTPQFSVPSGAYAPGHLVAITSATPGATIRYTLNGTTPTASSPILADGATLTLGNYTLKAIASRTSYLTSDVATATYSLTGDLTPSRMTAGHYHSAAVRTDGTVWAAGRNNSGQLGDGTTSQRSTPVIATLTGARSISAGEYHTLAVTRDGNVHAWGSNIYGQLADGTSGNQRSTPNQVSGLTGVVAVAAGVSHSLALTSGGQVWSWGRNNNGQIGDGGTSTRLTPYQVPGLSDVAGIAAGEAFSVAWTNAGAVWVWGANNSGQLGDGTQNERRSPVLLTTISNVTSVAAGRQHTLAATSTGALYAWGLNTSGQVGDNSTTMRLAPVLNATLTGVARVAAGYTHSFAITQAGALYAWGANGSYQVGDGTNTNRLVPTLLSNLPVIVDASGGFSHSIALDINGSLWTWGNNLYGQIGNGTTTTQTTPAPISDGGLTWGVSRPTFTPAPGTFTSAQQVTLSTLTPGATIRFTVDGTAPTSSSTLYTAPISIATGTTISAKAFKTGLADSAIATGVYVFDYGTLSTPTASPVPGTYLTPIDVTLSGPAGATLRYTTNGTTPTESSAIYTAPLPIAATTTVQARAFKTDWTPSALLVATYTISSNQTPPPPTIAPASGEYEYGQAITLSAPVDTTIRYTTDGAVPTGTSPLYSGPLTLTGPVTIRARVFNSNGISGDASSATYTVRASTPVFTPGGGTYAAGQSIAITDAVPGALIRYTTNGQEPTILDPLIDSGGSIVVGNFTLKAKAFAANMPPSDTASAQYVKSGDPCTYSFSPTGLTVSSRPTGGLLTVTTNEPSCTWTAQSGVPWVTLGRASGTGSGQIPYYIAGQPAPIARGGMLTIADRQIAVNQSAAASCTFTVTPPAIAATAATTTGTIGVTASDPSCAWAASANAPWVTVRAPSSSSAYAQAVLTDHPAGYWRLDAAPGATVVEDASGFGHTGTIGGGVTFGEPSGLSDGSTSASFDGATGIATIPDQAQLDLPSLTWEAWVNVAQTATYARRIFGKGATNEAFALWIGADAQQPTITWTPDGGSAQTTTLATTIVGAGWVHLAFTADGTTWRAFVNGAVVDTGALTASVSTNTSPLIFGGDEAGQFRYDGRLDEVALYPYALSAEQVLAHYAMRAAAGLGSGTLSYAVAQNETGASRTTTIAVATTAVPVGQAAVGEMAIVGYATPGPNTAGWNTTDVVVAFVCAGTGTVTCPAPVPLTNEGVQDITRTATDGGGHSATTTVTVRIDKTAPFITILSPVLGAVVSEGTLVISGRVTDALSAVTVTCAGQPATVTEESEESEGSEESFTCEQTIPTAGASIAVQATDAAGNVRTVQVEVSTPDGITTEPTSLRLSPQDVKMIIGQQRDFSVHDDLGRVPLNPQWTVDNPAVATFSDIEPGLLTAVAAGEVTITASWRGQTATTQVTVLATQTVVSGTVLWSVPYGIGPVGQFVQAATPDGTRITYVVERGGLGQSDVITALDREGNQRWTSSVGGTVDQLSATPIGGAVASVVTESERLLKLFSTDGRGVNGGSVQLLGGTNFAIHPLGPLYYVNTSGELASLDIGEGGGLRAMLPRGESRSCTGGTPQAPTGCTSVPAYFGAGTPTVLWDGSVVVPVVTGRRTTIDNYPDNPLAFDAWITVFYLRRDGTTTEHSVSVGGYLNVQSVKPFKAIPNGQDGVMVAWEVIETHGGYGRHANAAAFDANGATNGSVGLGERWGDLVLGEGKILATTYLPNPNGPGDDLKRMITPLTSQGYFAGATTILGNTEVSSVAAAAGGSFVMNYSNGYISGPDPGYADMQLTKAQYVGDGIWMGAGVDGGNGFNSMSSGIGLVAMAGPGLVSAPTDWPTSWGRWAANATFPRPLDTARLKQLAIHHGIVGPTTPTGVQRNYKIGVAFERFVLWSINARKNWIALPSARRPLYTNPAISTVIPDALMPHVIAPITRMIFPSRIYPASSLVEVKAVAGTITMDYSRHQIRGMIDVAATVTPLALSGRGVMVPITFITTSDTVIGSDVTFEAKWYSVEIRQRHVLESVFNVLEVGGTTSLNTNWWERNFGRASYDEVQPSGKRGLLSVVTALPLLPPCDPQAPHPLCDPDPPEVP
jgi:alpha-tubulin suppressor-like RCC1 family protein